MSSIENKIAKFIKICDDLENRIKLAKNSSKKEIFQDIGFMHKLNDLYIFEKDLKEIYKDKKYGDILYNLLEQFIKKNSLYANINLLNRDDREILEKDDAFEHFMDEVIEHLKNEYFGKEDSVIKFLENHEKGEEIPISDILSDVKMGKVTLLFVLSSLRDKKLVYDFNAREVTLN